MFSLSLSLLLITIVECKTCGGRLGISNRNDTSTESIDENARPLKQLQMDLFLRRNVPGTLIDSPFNNNHEQSNHRSRSQEPNASTVHVNERESKGRARQFSHEAQIDSTGHIDFMLTTAETQNGTNTPACSVETFRSNQSQTDTTTIEPTQSAISFEMNCSDQPQDKTATIEPTASVDSFETSEFGHSQHETVTAEDSVDLFEDSRFSNETILIQTSSVDMFRTDCSDESQDETTTIEPTGSVYSLETFTVSDSDESSDGETEHNDRTVAYNVSQGVKKNSKNTVKSVAALSLVEELESGSDHAIDDWDSGSQNDELNAAYYQLEVEDSQEIGGAATKRDQIVYFSQDDYVECIELPGTDSTEIPLMENDIETIATISTEVALPNDGNLEPPHAGQLVWAKLSKCPFWPSIVSPDSDGKITRVKGKLSH